MPGRLVPLVNNEIYHVFNRGSEKRLTFLQSRDYKRFLQTLYYYQFSGSKPKFSNFAKSSLYKINENKHAKLIEVLCYCLMPNHFHILIRQLTNGGISNFISQLSNSYTKYFNVKNKRVGALFQGRFKSVLVENDEQLVHVSRYIHLNPVVAGLVKNIAIYPWSSYSEYVASNRWICSTNKILNYCPSINDYKTFLEDQIEYGKDLEFMKHHILDEL